MTSLDPKEKPGPLQDTTIKSSRLLACAATLGIIYNQLYMWHPYIYSIFKSLQHAIDLSCQSDLVIEIPSEPPEDQCQDSSGS